MASTLGVRAAHDSWLTDNNLTRQRISSIFSSCDPKNKLQNNYDEKYFAGKIIILERLAERVTAQVQQ
jgi:hypothetical protein